MDQEQLDRFEEKLDRLEKFMDAMLGGANAVANMPHPPGAVQVDMNEMMQEAMNKGTTLNPWSGDALVRPMPQPLYDREIIVPGVDVDTITFFQRPQACRMAMKNWEKTNLDTNMSQGGWIATPQRFEVHGFTANIGGVPHDVDLVRNSAVLTFIFAGTRKYLEMPLSKIPARTERPFCPRDQDPVKPEQFKEYTGNMLDFTTKGQPFQIMPNESFKIELSFPKGLKAGDLFGDVSIHMFIEGYLYLPL